MPGRHGAIPVTPFLYTAPTANNGVGGGTESGLSTWLIVPYFTVYATMFCINTVISPILLLERSCIHGLPDAQEKQRFADEYASPNKSCIATHIMNGSASDTQHVIGAYSTTLYVMIAVIFASGNVSAISYFLIWKPLLGKCHNVALFLPPGLVLLQTVFLTVAQEFQHFNSYKYMILGSGVLPGLHGGLPGVFLLFYRMTKTRRPVTATQEITTTKLDCSDATFPTGIVLSGFCIYVWFDMRYYFLFMLQFALGCVGLVYAMSLLTIEHAFMTGDEAIPEDPDTAQEKEKVEKAGATDKGPKIWRMDSDSDISVDEFDAALSRDHDSFVSKQSRFLKQASLLFSGTTHKMELIIVVEVCVFTVAMTTDMGISVIYLLQTPIGLDMSLFGGCLLAQGITKLIGFALAKTFVYFKQIKHSTLITIALINYIIYYFCLSINWSKVAIVTAMFVNVFGGLALPAIASIIETSFKDTAEVVLELSILCSFVGTMAFNGSQYFIFERTLRLWGGLVFAITGGVLTVGSIIIFATYMSTSETRSERDRGVKRGLLGNG